MPMFICAHDAVPVGEIKEAALSQVCWAVRVLRCTCHQLQRSQTTSDQLDDTQYISYGIHFPYIIFQKLLWKTSTKYLINETK